MINYKIFKTKKIELIKVNYSTHHVDLLFEILKNRSSNSNLSHVKLPSYQKHKKFVNSRPYRYWFLIFSSNQLIGSAYITRLNEISIKLKKNNLFFYKQTLKLLLEGLKPLKGIPSKRRSNFLINVSPKDKNLVSLFAKMKLLKIQETYEVKA